VVTVAAEAQVITPEIFPPAISSDIEAANFEKERKEALVRLNASKGESSKKHLRLAAGRVWEDETLSDWPENDYRIFCGDLGNEVNDNALAKAFSKYPSFAKAKVIRDKKNSKKQRIWIC